MKKKFIALIYRDTLLHVAEPFMRSQHPPSVYPGGSLSPSLDSLLSQMNVVIPVIGC
jgi:hypothetical protein